jgi:enamine deaminase RidA (YjgF/YER057c/UK114 family)
MTDIAEILKSVPEVKLKILPLTWKLLGNDGHIDVSKTSYDTAEVDAALEEAEDYAQQTANAVQHLKNLLREHR